MTRHKKLMFAFLAIVALASTSCAKLQARDNLNKGVRAFSDAHYENAVDFFKEAIRLDPDLTNAEIYLATAYSQQFVPGATSRKTRSTPTWRSNIRKRSQARSEQHDCDRRSWPAFTRTPTNFRKRTSTT